MQAKIVGIPQPLFIARGQGIRTVLFFRASARRLFFTTIFTIVSVAGRGACTVCVFTKQIQRRTEPAVATQKKLFYHRPSDRTVSASSSSKTQFNRDGAKFWLAKKKRRIFFFPQRRKKREMSIFFVSIFSKQPTGTSARKFSKKPFFKSRCTGNFLRTSSETIFFFLAYEIPCVTVSRHISLLVIIHLYISYVFFFSI